MKKLLSVYLALMFILGLCSVASGEEMDPAYVGFWQMETAQVAGISLHRTDLDWSLTMYIFENGDCFLLKDGKVAVPVLVPQNGAYAMKAGDTTYPLVARSDGMLTVKMNVDGLVMTIHMARTEAPAPAAAACQPFVGKWLMKSVDLMGILLTSEDLGMIEMNVYESGHGLLKSDGGLAVGFMLVEQGGQVYMQDNAGGMFLLTPMADGTIGFVLKPEGIDMRFVMERAK